MTLKTLFSVVKKLISMSKHGQVYGNNALVYYNHNFFDQMSNLSSKVLFNWIFFHGALYCCVRYSNIEYQDEIFKTYH